MRPRIVIVDDDPSFLARVRALLEAEGFDVIGEAVNGLDGVAAAAELHPDLLLVDVGLPDIDGFDVAERVADEAGAPPVVLTSIRAESDFGRLIETSRALAFVMKDDISGETLAGFLDARAGTA